MLSVASLLEHLGRIQAPGQREIAAAIRGPRHDRRS